MGGRRRVDFRTVLDMDLLPMGNKVPSSSSFRLPCLPQPPSSRVTAYHRYGIFVSHGRQISFDIGRFDAAFDHLP
jgi:hypothetical protein